MTLIETGTEDLLYRSEDGVAIFTLNRPDRRNALSTDMSNALRRGISQAEDDDAVGAVVITGTGKAFCSGGDVKRMSDRTKEPRAERPIGRSIAASRKNMRELFLRLWEMPKPTIAILPGPAAGAGLSLALACDLRYAAEDAFLTTAFAKIGLSGDGGASWFMTQLIGSSKTLELCYFSPKISAIEAMELGLVNAVFPFERLEAEGLERARQLANGPRLALQNIKENCHRALSNGLGEALELEMTLQKLASGSEDFREGVQAFSAKRTPMFQGT